MKVKLLVALVVLFCSYVSFEIGRFVGMSKVARDHFTRHLEAKYAQAGTSRRSALESKSYGHDFNEHELLNGPVLSARLSSVVVGPWGIPIEFRWAVRRSGGTFEEVSTAHTLDALTNFGVLAKGRGD